MVNLEPLIHTLHFNTLKGSNLIRKMRFISNLLISNQEMDESNLITKVEELDNIEHGTFYSVPLELMPQVIKIISEKGYKWFVNSQSLLFIF